MAVNQWKAVKRKVSDLKPWARNPRKISKEAYARLKERIIARDLHDILKIDTDNTVLSGNQRLRVLIELEVPEVTCLIAPHKLTEQEREVVALESNKSDGVDDWDELANFDLSVLETAGFTETEVKLHIQGPDDLEDAISQVDRAKELNEKWKVRYGDLFQIGRHLLLCGDSTKQECVKMLMGGQKGDMVFTDPPYNVAYKGMKFDKIKGDEQSEDAFVKFSEEFIARMSESVKPGGVFYICSGYSSFPVFLWALRKNGFKFSTPIIWVKNSMGLGWGDYRHQHEMLVKTKNPRIKKAQPIMYGWKEGQHYFPETRFEADVWEIKKRASTTMSHPTQKPPLLIKKAIENSSRDGEMVIDFFGGSGGTLITCEQTNRICRMIELDPLYCAVTLQRALDAFPQIEIKQLNLVKKKNRQQM